ncbi:MAG: LD-carboxypeptidase [Planctomycetes bacterium]|nr:LD-carboxypeptidase [Planctomycetota bacterium]
MPARRIHLIGPAGPCRPFLSQLRLAGSAELIALVQECVGGAYEVSGDAALLDAVEDEAHGGRTDDARRASDIEEALADSNVAAIVALRGGAWFTRVLPGIDFSVLDGRRGPVAVFGFSELTTLVNIVAAHPRGRGVYDMGPAFLPYGLRRYAALRCGAAEVGGLAPDDWMQRALLPHFRAYVADLVAMIEGRGSERHLAAEVVRGAVTPGGAVRFVGGNLTVLSTLIGAPSEHCLTAPGPAPWLVLEDFNDKLERFDRFLAHITLARMWERFTGVLLGDFHLADQDLFPQVLELLPYHLPQGTTMPILRAPRVGHTWPMAPLPLHVTCTLDPGGADGDLTIRWPASALRVT